MASWKVSGQYSFLQSYFVGRMLQMMETLRKKSIGEISNPTPIKLASVWQEVFDNGDPISNETVVQVWKNWGTPWTTKLQKVCYNNGQTLN